MNDNQEIVCRFCLTKLDILDVGYETMDEMITQIFEVVQIEVNFSLTENSTLCNSCLEILKKLLVFKLSYISVEQMLLQFSLREDKAIIDLKDVYKTENDDTLLDLDTGVCRLCMKWTKAVDLSLINTLLDSSVIEKMLTKYMTEVDITITQYAKVCIHCKENIQCYSDFVSKMQAVESEFNLNRSTKTHLDRSQLKMYKCLQCSYETYREQNFNKHIKIHLDRSQLEMHKCLQCNYETHRKSDLNAHTIIHLDRSRLKMFKCLQCSYETYRKQNFNEHIKIHLDRSQLETYKCLQCNYETHRKRSLKRHTNVHLGQSQLKMYKCLQCNYKAHKKGYLTKHSASHLDQSQLKMYKCFQCSYETHRKSTLKVHKKTHLDRSQLEMYKCLQCNYETYRKDNLKRHTKTHLDKNHRKKQGLHE